MSHGCTRIKRGCMVAQGSSLCLQRISSDDFLSQRRKVAEENIPIETFLQAVPASAFGQSRKQGGFRFQNQPFLVVIASGARQSKKRLINQSPHVRHLTNTRDDHLCHVQPRFMDTVRLMSQNIFFNHEVHEEKRSLKSLRGLRGLRGG